MTPTLSLVARHARCPLSRAALAVAVAGLCGPLAARAEPASCSDNAIGPDAGFFTLRVGDDAIGVPATAGALQGPPGAPFAALVAPAGLKPAPSEGAQGPRSRVFEATTSPSGSALVRGSASLVVQNADVPNGSISLIAYQPAGAPALPVAAMVVDRTRWRSPRVMLAAFSLPESVRAIDGADVARWEHLYTLAFRHDADALYCMAAPGGTCAEDALLSQGAMLRLLALHRACAWASMPEPARGRIPRWHVVTLQPLVAEPGANARVSVKVSNEGAPLPGAQVMFSRPPHAACSAVTQADGTASCLLADTQGHEGGHPEFDRAPVLATFAGDLRRDPVFPPIAHTMPSANERAPRSFLAPPSPTQAEPPK